MYRGEIQLKTEDNKITIKVGKKDGDYSSLRECMHSLNFIKTENKRTEIILTDEKYFEQVIITKPDITLKAKEGVSPTISFYYGIGYKYKSIGESGYFEENKIAGKHFAKRWGATVIVEKSAYNFRAENINFENSFNLYMTESEISDGIERISSEEYGQSKCETNEDRLSLEIKVGEYHNKERAAALVCEADNSLFVNCNFKTSQDTLYAGHGKQRFIYCNIYGNIDYIFGEEDARADFIKCNLIWLGYTGEEASPGIICAPKGIFTFYKCRIEKNKDKKYKSIAGYLARPWRASGAVLFYKCDIEENSICKEGFTEMNKVTPEEVAFFEYENICNGKIFITDRGKELF